MNTKPIADYNKSLPKISNLTGQAIMVTDSSGNQGRAANSLFACCVGGRYCDGEVLRIKKLTSVLISARGSNGGRAAFVWVSSYSNGTALRTAYRRFFVADNYYEFYINGESETDASVYVKLMDTAGYDDLSVVSLVGEVPTVETVSSVPSDATRILLDS